MIGSRSRNSSTSATGKVQPSKVPSANTAATTTVASTVPPARNSSAAAIVDEPIAFFGSGAASWKAREGHSGGQEGSLWYQPYVISGSLAVFLLYFCVFREESDVDHKLSGDLFDHVAGLEVTQIKLAYNYNKEHGLPTEELERRLVELAQGATAE